MMYKLLYSVLIATCIASTFMLKGTVYKVPYLAHLYIFTLSPKKQPSPLFLIYLPQRNPLSKDTNLVQNY